MEQGRLSVKDLERLVHEDEIDTVLCMFTDLQGRYMGKRILPHVDGGSHAAYYERFHILLAGDAGSTFSAGDEWVTMAPGECWWFDNSKEHAVVNEGLVDRITLIVDIHLSKDHV